MFRPDEKNSNRQLIFELRNGHSISPKCVDKVNDHWYEIDPESHRLVNKDYGEKLDAERSRRYDIILDLICAEGRKGHAYTINQFCQAFKNKEGLDSTHSICDRLEVLTTANIDLKFNGVKEHTLTPLGFSIIIDNQRGIKAILDIAEDNKILKEVFASVDQHDCKRLKGILEILKNQEQDEEQKTKIYGWLEILEIAYLE